MSCNGCRVLRKGCSDNCLLRQCLHSIHTPEAQAHATQFVAKFFGRAGLMSFISAVPPHQRPALFQSLLYEACGRTVNPLTGAVGLLWTGNWHLCQSAMETVLRGGALSPLPEFLGVAPTPESDCHSEVEMGTCKGSEVLKRTDFDGAARFQPTNLDLRRAQGMAPRMTDGGSGRSCRIGKRRKASPSMGESETTTLESDSEYLQRRDGAKLLRLFV